MPSGFFMAQFPMLDPDPNTDPDPGGDLNTDPPGSETLTLRGDF